MKKFIYVLIVFIFIFSYSCKSLPDNTYDPVKTDDEEISQIVETEPLTVQEYTEPQIPEDIEIIIAEDDSSSVFEEFTEPEIPDEIVIAEAEPAVEEIIAQLPEPVVETPPVEKEQETPASPEVQTIPQAVPVPQVPQILARPAQESTPVPVEEKPSQPADNPVEEEPLVSESSPPVPSVVSALKNEPVIPPQTLPVIPPNGEIIYSRTVYAAVGQIIEIPFRGTGWVYLGELASSRGISYDSRRIDPEGQNFIFRSTEAGTYSLKFFKQDFIRDYILNDYVKVIVEQAPQANSGWPNAPQDRGKVTAQPRWPATLEEAEMQRSGVFSGADNTKTSSGSSASEHQETDSKTVTSAQSQGQESQNRTSTQEPSLSANNTLMQPGDAAAAGASQFNGNPDELLQKAKEAFDEGKVQDAISLLDQYKYFFPSGSDEAYWLYGQFYEANTQSRNVLLALDYYKRLIDEYPQSSRCNDARRRIQYLERFYININ